MADLVRVGLVLDAAGVQTGVSEAAAQFKKLSLSTDEAAVRLRRLEAAMTASAARGRPVSASARSIRDALRAQIPAAAAATAGLNMAGTAAAASEARFAMATRGITRLTFAAQMAAGGGGLRGLSMALLSLGATSGVVGAAVAGFALIATALTLIKRKADEARDSVRRFLPAAPELVGGAIRQQLEADIALLRGQLSATEAVPGRTLRAMRGEPAETLPATTRPRLRGAAREQAQERLANLLAQLALLKRRLVEVGEAAESAVPEAEAFWAAIRGLGHPLGTGPLAGPGSARAQFPLPDLELMTDQAVAAADAMNPLIDKMFEVGRAALFFGDAATAGFGALIDQMSMGNFGLSGLAKAVLREVSTMARAKALWEFAEGIGALFSLLPGSQALAAGHFRAAAAYGAAAVGAGLIGGGGGGVGGQGGGYSGGYSAGRPGSSGRPVIIVQIIGQTSREVVQEIVYDTQRDANRGGRALGTSPNYAVIPVQGAIVRRV